MAHMVKCQMPQSVVLSSIKKLVSQSIIQDIVKYMRSVTQVLLRCQVKCFVLEKQVKLKIWQAMRGKLFKGEVQWKTILSKLKIQGAKELKCSVGFIFSSK